MSRVDLGEVIGNESLKLQVEVPDPALLNQDIGQGPCELLGLDLSVPGAKIVLFDQDFSFDASIKSKVRTHITGDALDVLGTGEPCKAPSG